MYLYLRYYQYKLSTDSHYMIKQAIEHGVLMAPIVKEKQND